MNDLVWSNPPYLGGFTHRAVFTELAERAASAVTKDDIRAIVAEELAKALSKPSEPKLKTEAEAAAMLGVKKSWLATRRRAGAIEYTPTRTAEDDPSRYVRYTLAQIEAIMAKKGK
jgi:hypothetical protein